MKEERDHWACDGGCGCGVCVPAGQRPTEPEHVLHDGRACGTYRFDGRCPCSDEDDEA